MIGRNEADVLAHNGALPVERREHPVARNRGKSFDVGVARVEKDIAVLVLLDPHAKVVEQFDQEIAQERIGVRRAHPLQHGLGGGRIERVEFKQPVATFFQLQRERGFELDRLRHQRFERGAPDDCILAVSPRELEQAWLERVLSVVAAVQRRLERVEPAMIPLDHALFSAARDIRHMDPDRPGLPDAVEAADALFEQAGIERHIEEHEMVRELEVTPLAADLRADE